MQVELRSLEELIPHARNARHHSDAQVAQIAASIVEFGFNNPVLVDLNGGIIAGHGRVLPARKLGQQRVPVIVLGHLNENQKRAFMLADNQLALNAAWDPERLRLELEALAAQGFPLELTGFSDEDLKQLLAQDGQGLVDPDEVPALEAVAVIQSGDLWRLGKHRLLCGDETSRQDLDRVLDGRSCDLVFTDLPYNPDYRGKTPAKMKLANDNLGARFAEFQLAACRAMLAVS